MTDVVETSSGDRVAYHRYGEGPAVVLVAAAGSLRGNEEAATTAQLVAAEGLTVLVPDRLGRRESAAEGSPDLDWGVYGPRPGWLAGAKASPA